MAQGRADRPDENERDCLRSPSFPALRAPRGGGVFELTRRRSCLSPCRASAGRAFALTGGAAPMAQHPCLRSDCRPVARQRRALQGCRCPCRVAPGGGCEPTVVCCCCDDHASLLSFPTKTTPPPLA